MSHSFVDDGGDGLGELDVRHVQPYQAVKTYRCPGCDHEIPPGLGHEVVVPRLAPEYRRHWHTSCWARAVKQQSRRRREGPPRRATRGSG